MPETKSPQNDKGRKARSFGSYALFLFVLIAIFLLIGGNEKWRSVDDISQDQFLF